MSAADVVPLTTNIQVQSACPQEIERCVSGEANDEEFEHLTQWPIVA